MSLPRVIYGFAEKTELEMADWRYLDKHHPKIHIFAKSLERGHVNKVAYGIRIPFKNGQAVVADNAKEVVDRCYEDLKAGGREYDPPQIMLAMDGFDVDNVEYYDPFKKL